MPAARDGTQSSASPFVPPSCDALFAGWERYDQVALAVSGGADSVALMRLAHEWQAVSTGCVRLSPRLTVLTVNHGLREAAAAEAAWVAAEAARLGLPHHTLVWQGAKPASGIQAAARQARYALMAGFCRENGIAALAVAHTQDDQAETLLMRLARGSGTDGLAGMAPLSRQNGIDILRPLLGTSRAKLETWLRERGQEWFEDPSNQNARFERVRVRRALRASRALGLTAEKLALSATRLRRAREALEAVAAAFLRDALRVHDAGYGEIPLAALMGASEEISLRALARAAETFGGGRPPVRLARLEAMWAVLRSGARDATLAGCVFSVRKGAVQIIREAGRMDKAVVPALPGARLVWDGRYAVSLSADCPPGLTIRSLGADGMAVIRAAKGSLSAIPRGAALALPSLWEGGRLVFTPCVAWQEKAPLGWLHGCQAEFIHKALESGSR